MAEFITDTQTLKKLHKSVTVPGNEAISGSTQNFVEDYYFKVTEDGVKIQVISTSDDAFAKIDYSDVEVEEEGEVVIPDINKFSSILSRFGSDEKLRVSDNGKKLEISSEETPKKFSTKTQHYEDLDSYVDTSEDGEFGLVVTLDKDTDEDKWQAEGSNGTMNMDRKVVVDVNQMKEVIGDAQVIEARDLPFEIEDEEFDITLGSEYEGIHTHIETETVRGEDAKATYQKALDGIFKEHEGEITFYFNTNCPLIIETGSGENLQAVYLIAPKVE